MKPQDNGLVTTTVGWEARLTLEEGEGRKPGKEDKKAPGPHRARHSEVGGGVGWGRRQMRSELLLDNQ